ncbi:MAG: ABC transporter ATP-binding protein [Acidimicrobiia bacterium]
MRDAPVHAGPALEVEDLSVEMLGDHGWTTIVESAGFSLDRGTTLGVVGESGSGKTVMSLATMGLLPGRFARIAHGSVRLQGEELTGRSERQLQDVRGARMAMVFQEPMTSLNPAFTIGEQIAETVRRHLGLGRREAWRRAVEGLERVGIPRAAQRARSYPHQFSGGMRQRAAIAMALCCEPSVLIADEPTTALDVTMQAQILDLLVELRDESDLAMVFISHDLGVVAEISDRVMVMYAGQVVEAGPVAGLYERPHHPYTEALLAATPRITARSGPLEWIPGTPPVPGRFPAGCRFAPRCGHATEICGEAPIALRPTTVDRASRCGRVGELDLRGASEPEGPRPDPKDPVVPTAPVEVVAR